LDQEKSGNPAAQLFLPAKNLGNFLSAKSVRRPSEKGFSEENINSGFGALMVE
jgi:hypothetical protein